MKKPTSFPLVVSIACMMQAVANAQFDFPLDDNAQYMRVVIAERYAPQLSLRENQRLELATLKAEVADRMQRITINSQLKPKTDDWSRAQQLSRHAELFGLWAILTRGQVKELKRITTSVYEDVSDDTIVYDKRIRLNHCHIVLKRGPVHGQETGVPRVFAANGRRRTELWMLIPYLKRFREIETLKTLDQLGQRLRQELKSADKSRAFDRIDVHIENGMVMGVVVRYDNE